MTTLPEAQANTVAESVPHGGKRKRREAIAGALFVAPDLIGLVVFVVVPIFFAIYVSFQKWDMIGPMKFVGLDNYKQMMSDSSWWASLGRTGVLALEYVPTLFILSLVIAALLNYVAKRVGSYILTMILLPFSVTSVVAATLWMFLYDEKRGYLNSILNSVGISDQPLLGSQHQALTAIVAVMVWINLGYTTVLFSSAIKNIPSELYEAADIDGASRLHQFFRITVPLLKRTMVFVLVTTTVAAFQVMDLILVMTKGGPADATQVGVLYIYDRSFNLLQMGYGSALSVLLFVVLLVISVAQMVLTRDKKEEA